MKETFNPAAIANRFLAYGNENDHLLTPMQVLKLVYITHGWYLAGTGKPLIDEEVQAWKYGPVVPSLFHEFKEYGRRPVERFARVPTCWDEPFVDEGFWDIAELDAPMTGEDDPSEKYISWVWEKYSHLSGTALSELTHREGTPWSIAVKEMLATHHGKWMPNYPINNDLIRGYYVEQWDKSMAMTAA